MEGYHSEHLHSGVEVLGTIYLWFCYSPCGSWPLFQFLNSIHIRYDFLYGRSASRKAATYT
jgi:hypothetical protein